MIESVNHVFTIEYDDYELAKRILPMLACYHTLLKEDSAALTLKSLEMTLEATSLGGGRKLG